MDSLDALNFSLLIPKRYMTIDKYAQWILFKKDSLNINMPTVELVSVMDEIGILNFECDKVINEINKYNISKIKKVLDSMIPRKYTK